MSSPAASAQLLGSLANRLSSDLPTPLYLQIADLIGSAIRNNDLAPGSALPAERSLAEWFKVSRITVRNALESLTERGLIDSRRGSGHFVRAHVELPLSRLTGFSEEIRARGRQPNSRWIERSIGIATPEEAMALHLPTVARVARFVRLRLADDEIMAFEQSTIPAEILPEPEKVENSLYSALQQSDHAPVAALQYIRAINLERRIAELLQVPSGAAALLITRHATDRRRQVIEFAKSYYLGDRYDYVAELRRVP